MQPFNRLSGVVAPLPMINVDTDMIIPKQFLKTIQREGLGKSLFFEMRYDDAGQPLPAFVLNQEPFREARFLVAGANFGCGSSREHAPWALADFGIRCIIAPSFADIFYNNCFMNGMLPIVLPEKVVDRLMASADGGAMSVDLEKQQLISPDGTTIGFEIDPFRKACLLGGLDEISLTLQKRVEIASFEASQKARYPWLYA